MTSSTMRRGAPLDVLLDALDHARREAARDDAAQARVARIVHVDHRAEELGEVGRQVEMLTPPLPEQKSLALRLTSRMSA